MPKLTLSVRFAAGSLLLLGAAHTLFWGWLSFEFHTSLLPLEPPYDLAVPVLAAIASLGLVGILIAAGIFYARNWARVAVLVLAALVALLSLFAVLALVVVSLGLLSAGLGIEIPPKSDLVRIGFVYFLILAIALWWIILFSRKSVAAQFSQSATSPSSTAANRRSCPPPIALLGWLMIVSSVLSVLSWPLILGKIPAMLFAHIFSSAPSKWIWLANIVLFFACGAGLLKLQRWAYNGATALHLFWLASLLVTQLSPNYETYTRLCLAALQLAETYPILNRLHFPQWVSATTTAIPTALLIAGLFYYRPSFLKAACEARS